MNLKDLFKNRPYPGRFILIGKLKNKYVSIYGVTGRSESSLNRVYKKQGNKIFGVQTTKEFGGNKDLLEYSSMIWNKHGIVTANGNQIKITSPKFLIEMNLENLKTETVEPDKYLTPRITGIILKNKNKVELGLQSIRSVKGKIKHDFYSLSPNNNELYFISTYSGKDVRPTPSYGGKPILLKVIAKNVQELTNLVFESLSPKKGKQDYRVSVMGIEFSQTFNNKIINKVGQKK